MKMSVKAVVPMLAGAIFGVTLLCGATAAAASDGNDRHVDIVNETESTVTEVHASNVGTNDWEEDMLDEDVMAPGDELTFNIDDGTDACYYDFKVVFDDGSDITKYKVNVCQVSLLHITE